jgi:hypothetical protein
VSGGSIFLQNLSARDVRWHKVRRELDARKRQSKASRERVHEEGFGQARDTDEQAMTAGQQGVNRCFDGVFLPDDNFGDLSLKLAHLGRQLVQNGCWISGEQRWWREYRRKRSFTLRHDFMDG